MGFIGLGNVGQPMAANLLAAGYEIIGFDIKQNEDFIAAGGKFTDSLSALIEMLPEKAVIFQSLPNETALRATVDVLLTFPREQCLVDVSSYALEVKKASAVRLASAGISMLDCEVSGLPPHVASREATLFKSGEHAVIERMAPYFDAVAKRHIYLGDFGMATRMKLIANVMVCAHNLIAAEALSLGRSLGLDPLLIVDALSGSAASSATFVNKAPLMLSRDFAQGRGPFRHMFGYLSRARAMADDTLTATPVLNTTSAIYAVAESEGRHDQDIAAIIEIIENMRVEGNAHA
ncbi:NAD(P)-dependent oxidoreductase [Sphingobium sp. CECT 9361]|uniref:NAD(P)-dependent oxidoreductase n=1 Tax=Sphingobium sp. CECT 9361 TaxID=2845384 RepID=UPI0025B6D2C0|nr:NAD(P)-dependent oxidoreductase [Sphingobium sp. CECT 9361]